MSEHDPLRSLVLELALAVGMIGCLVGAMFIHTGSMPPLVVVESSSMIHSEDGEIGSIDAGDLILVHVSWFRLLEVGSLRFESEDSFLCQSL